MGRVALAGQKTDTRVGRVFRVQTPDTYGSVIRGRGYELRVRRAGYQIVDLLQTDNQPGQVKLYVVPTGASAPMCVHTPPWPRSTCEQNQLGGL